MPKIFTVDRALCLNGAGEVIVHRDNKELEMSKIFKWYKQDFGSAKALLPWLVQYLTGTRNENLQYLLDTVGPTGLKISYRDYDWSINS